MDPVPIACAPQCSGATMLFRYAGELWVTVVVKRSFALVPGRANVSPIPPAPIVRAELAGGGRFVPDDLAPFLPQAEVWATGRVRSRLPHAALEVALCVRRANAVVLEKRARVVTDVRAVGRLDAFGPSSRRSPLRARRLGTIAPSALEGSMLNVPDAIDWTYFHTTEPDQRIASFEAGDEIALEIVGVGALSLRLPDAAPEATLREMSGPPSRIDLRADAVSFDVDRSIASIVYRGRIGVAGDPRRANVEVRAPEPPPQSVAGAAEAALTTALSDEEVAVLRASFPTPFRAGPSAAFPSSMAARTPVDARSGLTAAVDDAEVEALRARLLPFSRVSPSPAAPVPPISPAAPPSEPVPLPSGVAPAVSPSPRAAPAVPSVPASPPTTGATSFADPDEIAELRARYATPFDKPSAKLARQRGILPKIALPGSPAEAPPARSGETLAAEDPAALQAIREQYKATFPAKQPTSAPIAARSSVVPASSRAPDAKGSAGASFLDALGEDSEDGDGTT